MAPSAVKDVTWGESGRPITLALRKNNVAHRENSQEKNPCPLDSKIISGETCNRSRVAERTVFPNKLLQNNWFGHEGGSPMADYIYCGTDPPVGADGTQQLLLGPYNAIWCPPNNLPVVPAAGDRVWLVWRASAGATPVLLGGGRILATYERKVLWTNRTLPGVRPAAQAPAIGYPGPTNMAFLHLGGVVAPEGRPNVNLGAINDGLSPASAQQTQTLSQLLPIV